MENLTLTIHNKDKRNGRKWQLTYIMSLCKWIMEQDLGGIERKQALLRDAVDRKLWRVMNSYILYLKEILLYGVIIIPFLLILPLESLVLMIILAGD